jgi:hypothetical protein
MALDDPYAPAPLDPYAGMLPDWTDEHERLYQQYIAPPDDTLAVGTTLGPKGEGPAPIPPPPPAAPPPPVTPRVLGRGRGNATHTLKLGADGITPVVDEVAAPDSPVPLPYAAPMPAAPGTDAAPQDPYAEQPLAPDAAPGVMSPDQQAAYDQASANQAALPASLTPEQRINASTGVAGQTSGSPIRPEEYDTPDEFNARVLGESDEQNALREHNRQIAYRDEETRRIRAKQDEYYAAQEAEWKAHQAAKQKTLDDTERLTREAQELANAKIDPDKWWHDRSTPQTIAAVISVIAGGLAAAKTGGPNSGLAMIQQAIDRDIDSQKESIALKRHMMVEQRQSIQDRIAQINQDYHEVERHRIASYERAINEVHADMQNFDPRGSQAQEKRELILGLRAKKAQAIAAYEQQSFKNNLDQARVLIDADKQQLEREKFLAQQKRLGAGAGKVKPVKPEDQPHTAEELRAMGVPIPEGVALPAGGWSLNTAKHVAETAKSFADWQEAARKADPIKFALSDIVDSEGKPVEFRDETVAKELANQKSSVTTATQLIDELARLISANGWSSDTMKSPEWAKTQGALASLLLSAKNTDQLGVLSQSDIDLEMKKLTGGLDPTGMRDATVGLLAARDRMVNEINTKLSNQAKLKPGQKLRRWEPPDLYHLPKAEPLIQGRTSQEQGEDAKLGSVGKHLSFTTNEDRAERAANAADVGPTGLAREDDERTVQAIREARGKKGEDAIQRLADAASGSRESVRAGILKRIKAEDPAVYDKVVAKLPDKIREDLAPEPTEEISLGSPQYKWETLTPDQIADRVRRGDRALQSKVQDLAVYGTTADKAKALDVIKRVTGK